MANKDTFIYVASPYTSPKRTETEARYIAVRDYTAKLIQEGYPAFSPIVHCHELACFHNLPTDFEFWKKYNFAMLRGASELQVLALPGWEASIGVQGEIAFAEELNLPYYIFLP